MNNHQDGQKEGERKPVISPEKIRRLRERFYILPSCIEVIALVPFSHETLKDIPDYEHLRSRERPFRDRERGVGIHPEWLFHSGDGEKGLRTLSEGMPRNAAKFLIYLLGRAFERIESGEEFRSPADMAEAAIACGVVYEDEKDLRRQFNQIINYFCETYIYIPPAEKIFPIMERDYLSGEQPGKVPAVLFDITLGHAIASQRLTHLPVVIPKALIAEEDAGDAEIFAATMIYSSMLTQHIETSFECEAFTWAARFSLFDKEHPLTALRNAFNNLQAMGILERWSITAYKPLREWNIREGENADLTDERFSAGGVKPEFYNFHLHVSTAVTLEV